MRTAIITLAAVHLNRRTSSVEASSPLSADLMSSSPLMQLLQCAGAGGPICMNGGICVDWGNLLMDGYTSQKNCICASGFYGPRCGYRDNFRVTRSLMAKIGDRNGFRVYRDDRNEFSSDDFDQIREKAFRNLADSFKNTGPFSAFQSQPSKAGYRNRGVRTASQSQENGRKIRREVVIETETEVEVETNFSFGN